MLYKDPTATSAYDTQQALRFRWHDALLLAPNLSDVAKLTGLLLAKYFNVETGACFPSQEQLALDLGKTTRTVANAVRELKDKRWIAVERLDRHKSNQYQLLHTHVDDVFTLNDDRRNQLKDDRERKRRSYRRPI